MNPLLEKELKTSTSKERLQEMKKYGRDDAYKKIHGFLNGDVLEGFTLVNYALAIADDVLDKMNSKDIFKKLKLTLRKSFQGKSCSSKEKSFLYIQKLGRILRKLDNSNFTNARFIYKEVIRFWEADCKDLERIGKILSQDKIDALNKNIGESVALQFMYFLFPKVNRKIHTKISSLYGLAVKSADNLSDLGEDISRGLINISKENLRIYNLEFLSKQKIINGDLKAYKEAELQRVKELFYKADRELVKCAKEYTDAEMLHVLVEGVFKSWLRQVVDRII